MERLESLSRDDLRKEVAKLSVLSKLQIRTLKKSELLEVLKENIDELNNVSQVVKKEQTKVVKQFKNTVAETKYNNDCKNNNIDTFLNKIEKNIMKDFKEVNLKVGFNVEVEMEKPGTFETLIFFIQLASSVLLQEDDRSTFYNEKCIEIKNNIEQRELKGSGWSFKRIKNLTITQNVYNQFGGGSYIPLPKWIENKKAIINIKNSDLKCFLWCLLAFLFPVPVNAERVNHYKNYENNLNFKNINFPVEIKDIQKIEKMNNLAINVFSYEKERIISVHLSKRMTNVPENRIIDLFMIKDETNTHYCLIKNINRLLGNEVSSHTGTTHICRYCFSGFNKENKYKNHVELCSKNKPVEYIKPLKEYVKFENIIKAQKIPIVIYADFESIIEKYDTADYNPNNSWTVDKGKHTASAFCTVVIDSDGKIMDIKKYRGKDAGKKFNEYIINKCDEINIESNFIPVFFHNLKGYDSHLILSSINNEIIKHSNITVIPNNSEKYISFSYIKSKNNETNEIRFLDSFSFMASSLDTLSKNLNDDQMRITKEYYKNEDEFELMRRKGIYPYEYMDSFKRYDEIELPNKEKFYDELNNKHCTDENYEYAEKVYKKMNCKNLGDYTDIYMINDVLMLCDVFETFRKTCMVYYGLDPCYYFTAPGLAWDAMLKITKVKLQTIRDNDMFMFLEKGIRGGMVNAVKRYVKANNRHMNEKYNPDKASKYLMYLDANNLYGWAMIQKLPYDELRFEMNKEEFENFDSELYDLEEQKMKCKNSDKELIKRVDGQINQLLMKIGNYGQKDIEIIEYQNFDETDLKKYIESLNKIGKGCILEVDLEYPKDIHDSHNDFPFCPQNTKINNQKVSKLMNTLYEKEKYVIHYKALIQALDHGLKLKKINRILTFKERNYMEKYIMLNTNLRKQAKNTFEKDFFKLMNNAVFGKTMENIRNRVDIKLITDEEKSKKLIKKPNFKNSKIITENLLSIEMNKTRMIFDKPIYVGLSILDLSKTLMYEFHYDVMQKRYGKDLNLCYQDTDSLIYEVETKDIYEDMGKMKEWFDFSDYPKEHPLYDESNKKVIGKFKDELNCVIMEEGVFLKPKQYAFRVDGEEHKKAKGVKKNVTKTLTLKDYRQCLFDGLIVRKKQYMIQSKKHQIYTVIQNKVALNEDDNDEFKRYICDDKYTTLAHGHNLISSENEN